MVRNLFWIYHNQYEIYSDSIIIGTVIKSTIKFSSKKIIRIANYIFHLSLNIYRDVRFSSSWWVISSFRVETQRTLQDTPAPVNFESGWYWVNLYDRVGARNSVVLTAGTTFADLSRCLNISSSAAVAAAAAFDAPRIIVMPSMLFPNDHRERRYALETTSHSTWIKHFERRIKSFGCKRS